MLAPARIPCDHHMVTDLLRNRLPRRRGRDWERLAPGRPPGIVLAIGLLLLTPDDPALAAWQPNGFQFAGSAARSSYHTPIPDGAGGWYVGWKDPRFGP